ncbi:esterase-like activity of phytase family protein [Iningainema tapete]|uniref:Esterase-like activity of phytase family protein n=1 Tax=Iningainema tapete BLCC-T55 TaxID=2748662 RepID=A0A8J6XQW2_9CYAN|nr:esterase-like activity of phytase family protein [Iningainema tapete]MBD2776614.1 esterase-like activity of phytase family protein [Iningainema tapete BLCC-T55]
MVFCRHWLSVLSCSLVISVVSAITSTTSAYGISLVNSLTIGGESTDLYPFNGNSANVNRLGFFSDLYYDRSNNVYYGLSDRGPGGGVISYDTRVQKFSVDVDPNTGAIANFKVLETILFTKDGQPFNGLNPRLLNGNAGVLGQSFDPEGFAVAPNGNFYVSDEYGPSVYEFSPTGSFLRAFATPENLIPKTGNSPNFVDGSPTITTGRQDNRGFEGLTTSPDGSKLYAVLQDPLVEEGSPDGRRSRNVRLVEFDTVTGQNTAQYIYQLESLTEINNRIPGTDDDFGQNSQGRNIGLSAITFLNDQEFLVLERDNRGFGVDALNGLVDDATATPPPVSSKRLFKINLTGATDVSGISLATTNDLPAGVNPVSKSLFLDIAQALSPENPGDWTKIGEKMEGVAIAQQLNDGSYALLIGTDNDYSVTQLSNSPTQFDVCSNADGSSVSRLPIDSGCPAGQRLVPGFLYSFKVSAAELGLVPSQKVPEPTTTAGLILLGLALLRHSGERK